MKKVIFSLAAVLAVLSAISCSKEDGGRIKSISFSQDSYSIFAGQQIIPDLVVVPEKADRSAIEWSSNNPSVASVSSGYVTGVSEGDATITAKCGRVSASTYVHVQWVDVVSCNAPSSVEIGIGASVKVKFTDFKPVQGNLANLRPVIQDGPANTAGTVQAVDVFRITNVDVVNNEVTVTSSADVADGYSCFLDIFRRVSDTKVASVKIIVANRPFQSVSLSDTQRSLHIGKTFELSAVTVPASPTDGSNFAWKLSDPSVLEISNKVSDKEIQLLALKEGTCTVTVEETLHGKSAQCVVTVLPRKSMAPGEQFYFYNSLDRKTGKLSGRIGSNVQVSLLPGKYLSYYIGLNDGYAITYEDKVDIETQYGTRWSLTGSGAVSGESSLAPDPDGLYAYVVVSSGDASVTVKAPNGSSGTISAKAGVKSVSMCVWDSGSSDPHWQNNVTTLPIGSAAFEITLPKYSSTGALKYMRFAINSLNDISFDGDPKEEYAPYDLFNSLSCDVYSYRTMLAVTPSGLKNSSSEWTFFVRNNSLGKTAPGIYTFNIEQFGVSWTLNVKAAN